MAHEIELKKEGYLGRQSAWHNLGTVKGDHLTRADIDAQGINFKAVKMQLEHNGKPIEAWGVFHENGIFIATCGKDYAIHQVSSILDTVDSIIGLREGAKYETAGILGRYQTVWVLADIKASLRVGDDLIKPYVAGITSFNGSMASNFILTYVRIVCDNTMQIAMSQEAKTALRVRHTSKSHRALRTGTDDLMAISGDFKTVEERLNFLNSRMLDNNQVRSILEQILEKPNPIAAVDRQQANMRRENILNDIIAIYEINDNDAFPNQRGTAYNLFNAVTNFVDHERSTRTSDGESADYKRSVAALFGTGAQMKDKAMEVITLAANKYGKPKPVRTVVTGYTPTLDSIVEAI